MVAQAPPPRDLWAKILADLHVHKPYLASQLRSKARPSLVEEGTLELWLPDTGLKTPKDLAIELKHALTQIYDTKWDVVAVNKQAKTETMAEIEARQKTEAIKAATQHKDIRKVLETFKGAQVVDVIQEN